MLTKAYYYLLGYDTLAVASRGVRCPLTPIITHQRQVGQCNRCNPRPQHQRHDTRSSQVFTFEPAAGIDQLTKLQPNKRYTVRTGTHRLECIVNQAGYRRELIFFIHFFRISRSRIVKLTEQGMAS